MGPQPMVQGRTFERFSVQPVSGIRHLILEILPQRLCYRLSQKRRNSISDLLESRCPAAFKKIVVWKRLDSRCLAHRNGTVLLRIGMNEMVAILGNVGDQGVRLAKRIDHFETVRKVFLVLV